MPCTGMPCTGFCVSQTRIVTSQVQRDEIERLTIRSTIHVQGGRQLVESKRCPHSQDALNVPRWSPDHHSSMSLTRVCRLEGHVDRVWDVSWHPKGTHIATASADRTVRVWGQEGDAWVCQAVLQGAHTRTVRSGECRD